MNKSIFCMPERKRSLVLKYTWRTSLAVFLALSSIQSSAQTTGTADANVATAKSDDSGSKASTSIVLEDDFDGDELNTVLWKRTSASRGETTVGHSSEVGNGYVDLRMDQTDNGGQIVTRFAPLQHVRVTLKHNMHPGNDNFFPTVYLESAPGIAQLSLTWLRSTYDSDYCNRSSAFNRVRLSMADPVWCDSAVFSDIPSSSFYDRWTTAILDADMITGVVKVDLDADGTIDMQATLSPEQRKAVTGIGLHSFGWYTGHWHRIDHIRVENVSQTTEIAAVSEPAPIETAPAESEVIQPSLCPLPVNGIIGKGFEDRYCFYEHLLDAGEDPLSDAPLSDDALFCNTPLDAAVLQFQDWDKHTFWIPWIEHIQSFAGRSGVTFLAESWKEATQRLEKQKPICIQGSVLRSNDKESTLLLGYEGYFARFEIEMYPPRDTATFGGEPMPGWKSAPGIVGRNDGLLVRTSGKTFSAIRQDPDDAEANGNGYKKRIFVCDPLPNSSGPGWHCDIASVFAQSARAAALQRENFETAYKFVQTGKLDPGANIRTRALVYMLFDSILLTDLIIEVFRDIPACIEGANQGCDEDKKESIRNSKEAKDAIARTEKRRDTLMKTLERSLEAALKSKRDIAK